MIKLEENIGRTLFDLNCNVLLGPSPRVMEIKTKINKWDLIKLLCFNQVNFYTDETPVLKLNNFCNIII